MLIAIKLFGKVLNVAAEGDISVVQEKIALSLSDRTAVAVFGPSV